METINLLLGILASLISIFSVLWNLKLRKEIRNMKVSGKQNIASSGRSNVNNTGNNSTIIK